MAKDIRAVLATLPAESGDCLSALYISDQPDRSDAENVLFYNVGTSIFRKFARLGMKFERGFGGLDRGRSAG